MTGTVYTETTIYSPPEAFIADAPYQLAIIEVAAKKRVTGRILGEAVKIGDPVVLAETRDGIPYFRKA
ncbi:MAG: OB-fold domain-containing protein [Bryobacterales bacterium]|nr:OB-fold domain-containing protein [Bryobacterales bacterium]